MVNSHKQDRYWSKPIQQGFGWVDEGIPIQEELALFRLEWLANRIEKTKHLLEYRRRYVKLRRLRAKHPTFKDDNYMLTLPIMWLDKAVQKGTKLLQATNLLRRRILVFTKQDRNYIYGLIPANALDQPWRDRSRPKMVR